MKPIIRKELYETIQHMLNNPRSAAAKRAPKIQVVAPPADPVATTAKARLLVADDSPDNRLLISAFLRREPYQIDFAENGEIAVARFREHSYDVVVMDIQMPILDGLAATRLIRQWESEHGGGHTPVIALTASVLDQDVRNTRDAGCDLHLSKPIKKAILIEALRNATSPPHAAGALTSDGAIANGADTIASSALPNI
jgi:CheY-like chemotaxis protein